jgi:hypothetical protein
MPLVPFGLRGFHRKQSFKNYGSTNPLKTAPLEQKLQMQLAFKTNPPKK